MRQIKFPRFRWVLRTVLWLVMVCILGVAGLTLTSPGLTVLASLISSVSSTPHQNIQIAGISGLWTGKVKLSRLAVSDPQGPWLAVKNATVEWQPTALLSGHFLAQSIAIETVALERLPQSDNGSEPTSSSTLPVTVEIRTFEIANLSIAPSIAGKQNNLRVAAAAKIGGSPLDLQARMRIRSLDHQSEILDLAAAFQPEMDRADVRLTVNEPPDGIIANLLQIDGSPAFRLRLTGQGPLANWKINLAGSLDGQPILGATGTLRATDTQQALTLVGTSEASRIVPPAYRPIIGEKLDIDIDVMRSDTGKINVQKAKIGAEQFFFSAKGTFDPQGNNAITGGFSARDAALNITDGLVAGLPNFAPHSLAFTVTGSGSEARIEATADVPLIDTGEVQLVGLKSHLLAPKFNLQNWQGAFSTQTSVDSIMASNENLTRLMPGEQFFTAEGSVTASGVQVDAIGYDNARISLAGTAQFLLEKQQWQAALTGNVDPASLPPAIADLIGEPVRIEGSASGNVTGELTAELTTLQGGPVIADGRADIRDGTIDGVVQLSVATLQGLVDGLDGALTAKLAANGKLEGPKVDLRLDADRLTFNDHAADGLELTVKGEADLHQPDLRIDLSGDLDRQSIKGGARLYVKEGQRVLEALRLESGQNSIDGALIFDNDFIPQGVINLDLPDLQALAALALQEITGRAKGTVRFANPSATPTVMLELTSEELNADALAIQGTAIAVSVVDYLAEPKLSGKISVRSALSGGTLVADTRLDLSQQGDWTAFDLTTTANKIPLNASGKLLAGDAIRIELANARANVQSIPVALTRPATAIVRDGTVTLRQLEVGLGKGTITLAGSAGETLDIAIAMADLDAALANQFVPDLGAGGAVSGQATVSGSPSQPLIRFDMRLASANVKQTRDLGVAPLNIASSGTFTDNTLSIRTRTSNRQGLAVEGGGTIGLAGPPMLKLAFDGKAPFPLLARQLSTQGIVLEGTSNLSVAINGAASKPQVRGTITANGGRFVHAQSGIAINNLDVDLAMLEERVDIKRLTGNLSTGGRVEAGGTIGVAADGAFPADIKLTIRDGVYTDHQSVSSKFDANLALNGPLARDPIASGTISLKRTTVTIPERIPGTISALDVQHKNATAAISQQASAIQPAQTQSKSGMRLAMDILANNQIFVRGRGLDAELGGALKLTNSLSNPQAQGAFQIRRGRLSILGKRLDFKRGQMNFAGSLVPELDVTAETQRDQYTISINVAGPADNPQFKFTSAPALAEDEVLAMLVFGKDIGSLSALQIVQLGQAAATLTGRGGNSSLLDKFQKLIKVDDLDVKTDSETGETTVGVGRYINDKTYVGVERGTSAGTGKATIDLTIGQGVKLRGEAGEDGQNKAGIFYEREY